MNKLTPVKWTLGAALIAYPALVYYGLENFGPRLIALLLFVVASVRSLISRDHLSVWLWLIALAAAAFSWVDNSPTGLKFYPVLVSIIMLGVFSISLYKGPTVIERFARLQEPNLPPEGILYCRKVTLVWCVFFIFNGSIAAATTFADNKIWALYNGCISYLLMGLLFAGEYLVRLRVKKNSSSTQTL